MRRNKFYTYLNSKRSFSKILKDISNKKNASYIVSQTFTLEILYLTYKHYTLIFIKIKKIQLLIFSLIAAYVFVALCLNQISLIFILKRKKKTTNKRAQLLFAN